MGTNITNIMIALATKLRYVRFSAMTLPFNALVFVSDSFSSRNFLILTLD